MTRYRLVESATRIPVPGGKLIEELFGRVNTGTDAFSLAHMIAPPGWSEPAQCPAFGELTIMIRGAMQIEVGEGSTARAGDDSDSAVIALRAGQAFWVEPGVRVRYSNPYPEEGEYYAICLPAFSPDRVHREDD
jgi:mannose-6-phosphate isomerase-like protein (cupin superfamily)